MKRQTQSESERAESERERLVQAERPVFDPAANCKRCFGGGREIVVVDGYKTARQCNHEPLVAIEDLPF